MQAVGELNENDANVFDHAHGDDRANVGLDQRFLHPYMWAWKPHYYSAEESYYNFPYAFGLLFGLGLHKVYKDRGEEFLAQYDNLLASTGEGMATDLAATMQATISGGSYGSNSIQNLLGGTLTIVGTSFNLAFGPVAPGGTYNGPLTGTLADGSAINTTLVKSSSSSVTLVEGTQGPLTSTVCDSVPSVPAVPNWAIGLGLMALAATGAVLVRRLHPLPDLRPRR